MSCVCILTPVVIAAWPAFSAAVVAAATSLGYQVVAEAKQSGHATTEAKPSTKVSLEIPQSELVTSQLARDQRLAVTRDGVTVIFARDARGKASLCVTGTGQSDEELRKMGEELSGRVVQQYVYQKLMGAIQTRGFVVVEEETDAGQSIRLKVRHWDG